MKCCVENSHTAVFGILSSVIALHVHLCGLQTRATLIFSSWTLVDSRLERLPLHMQPLFKNHHM